MASYAVDPVTLKPIPSTVISTGGVVPLGFAGQISTAGGAVTAKAPPNAGQGGVFYVQDSSGNAAANPITVDGNGHTIDGAATVALNRDNALAAFVFDGSEWKRSAPRRIFDDDPPIVPYVRDADLSGSGASVTVAADIAQSGGPGTAIDRVQGFRGQALTAAAPALGDAYVFTSAPNFAPGRPVPRGWFDLRQYGAVGDGVADDAPAFAAAMAAMGSGGIGGTLFVPSGTFRCASDVQIEKQIVVQGVSGGNQNSLSQIVFDAGKGFIAWHGGGPTGGFAQGWSMRQLDISSTKITTTAWAAATAYVVGDKRIATGFNMVYLECIKAGTSAGAAPAVPYSGDYSFEFQTAHAYLVGQIVRGSNDGAAIAPNGSNLITSVFFKVTVAGVSAGVRPAWDVVVGHATVSGGATFVAVDSIQCWMIDNTCVWAAKVHSAVWMRSRGHIENVYIKGFTNAGVMIRGTNEAPPSNANTWKMDRVVSEQCGIGFMASGSDSNVGVATSCDVSQAGYGMPGNAGIGFLDASFLGCTWIAAQVANDPAAGGGKSHSAEVSAQPSIWIGPYSESSSDISKTLSKWNTPAVVIGPTLGSGIDPASTAVIVDSGDLTGVRHLTGRNVFHDEAKPLYGYVGAQNEQSVFAWQYQDDALSTGIAYTGIGGSLRIAGWAPKWWTIGRSNLTESQAIAIPGEGAAWPSAAAISEPTGRNYPAWIARERLHIGERAADPPSIGFGAAAPAAGYSVKGSVVWNSSPASGQPMGWQCSATGTPGTWLAMANTP